MSRYLFSFQFSLSYQLLILSALLGLSSAAWGTTPPVPSSSNEQCQVILRYEGLCGNQRPNACLQIPEVDYYRNMDNQKKWDDYFWLCVNPPGAPTGRYSHECIQYLGITTTCHSTVPDLVEYHAVPPMSQAVAIFREEPKYVAASRPSVRACLILTDDEATVRHFHEACGNVSSAECSNSTAPTADFRRVCGTKNPCDCIDSYGCHADYCQNPVLGTPSGPLTPTTDGDPTSPTEPGAVPPAVPPSSTERAGETPELPSVASTTSTTNEAAVDPSFVLGTAGTENSPKSGNGSASATGCSLHASPSKGSTHQLWLIFWILVPTLGFRGRFYFNSLSQR